MTPKIPLIALVGRPNVGKSTLFNRLVGKRTALVDDQPGVTRDRLFGEAQLLGRTVRVVDTGGLDVNPDDPLIDGMRQQAQLAIDEADLILFVVDAMAGLTPVDQEIAALLRRRGAPAIVLANKVDAPSHESAVAEFYELGLEEVVGFSAEHGRGFDALEEAVLRRVDAPLREAVEADNAPVPVAEGDPDELGSRIEWHGAPIRVAVIGRPNAGKSSLINSILGTNRLLASEVPGTTRDPIDTEIEHDGQGFVFIDTAGVRRKRSIDSRLERFAVTKSFQSIDRADVVLLVLDGTERPSDQDARIAGMAHEKGKGIVVVANKWDLVENPQWREAYRSAVVHQMSFLAYAPVISVSAKTGRNVSKLFDAVISAQRERHRRVGTGELNRFFKEKVEHNPPPGKRGKAARLYYVSQPLVRPPTFVFSCNRADGVHFSYQRYLENALRERYGFEGTPIWLKFRGRSKANADA